MSNTLRRDTPPKILIACNSQGRMLDRCFAFPNVCSRVWGIVSDRPSGSISVAEAHCLNRFVVAGGDDEELSARVLALCTRDNIGYIISVGYTRIFRGAILQSYKGRMLNSHFSILPAFPGRRNADWTTTKHPPRAIFERTLEFGARMTGNTIHLIDDTIDGGAPVIQSSLVVPYDEDPRHTRHRLFVQECQCLMQTIIWLSNNRLVIRDDKYPQIKDATFDSLSFSPSIEEEWVATFNPDNSTPLEFASQIS